MHFKLALPERVFCVWSAHLLPWESALPRVGAQVRRVRASIFDFDLANRAKGLVGISQLVSSVLGEALARLTSTVLF